MHLLLGALLSLNCRADALPNGECSAAEDHVALALTKNTKELASIRIADTPDNSLLYAMKKFELSPTRRNSSLLMRVAPHDATSIDLWQGISATSCSSVSNSSLSTLVLFNESLPLLMSRAVLHNSKHMATYLRFNIAMKSSVDSDFLAQLSRTCRAAKKSFALGINSLGEDEKSDLREIINTETCGVP